MIGWNKVKGEQYTHNINCKLQMFTKINLTRHAKNPNDAFLNDVYNDFSSLSLQAGTLICHALCYYSEKEYELLNPFR